MAAFDKTKLNGNTSLQEVTDTNNLDAGGLINEYGYWVLVTGLTAPIRGLLTAAENQGRANQYDSTNYELLDSYDNDKDETFFFVSDAPTGIIQALKAQGHTVGKVSYLGTGTNVL